MPSHFPASSRAPSTLRIAWLLALTALLALGVRTWRASIDPEEQVRYGHDLRQLQAIDARLNEDVLASRMGLTMQYDAIARGVAELSRLHGSLAAAPRFLEAEARAELAGLAAASLQTFKQKKALVEDFKTDNAVLRNSLRYLPIAARKLGESEGHEIDKLVGALVADVLLFDLLSDEETRKAVVRELALLSAEREQRAFSPSANELSLVIRHAGVVLERKPRLSAATEAVLSLPSRERAEALDAAFDGHCRSAYAADTSRRLGVLALCLLALSLASLDVNQRQRRAARALLAAKSELTAANHALAQERERERELRELKSKFVSMASHEFRTPLAVIMSSCELLEAYDARWTFQKKTDHFTRIKNAVKGMTGLLEAVLVIGAADADRLESKPALVDLESFCGDLCDSLRQGDGEKHRIDYEFSGVKGGLDMDERLLGQILTNLLSNAIKYSPEGGAVRLGVRENADRIVFEVEDQGIGIADADHAQLFESFHRGGNVGKIPGSGLGLAIVKRALDVIGGRITIASEEGVGTKFVVEVPRDGRAT